MVVELLLFTTGRYHKTVYIYGMLFIAHGYLSHWIDKDVVLAVQHIDLNY